MCGITGFWLASTRRGSDESSLAALRRMNDAIAHRGPDDQDLSFDEASGVGLGHRRLSIIDLSPEGRQPMRSASGRYSIVFNGEVYNFKLVAAELERSGRAPAYRGGSDTEVMLAAFEAWGIPGALERFVGMFAFALWDREERCLTLARDRLGVKPLYYAFTPRGLLFGSELKALLGFPGFEPRVAPAAVQAFLRWGHVPAPISIYEGVQKLEPGCYLQTTSADAASSRSVRYWDAVRVAQRGLASPLAPPEGEAELERTLKSAVALRMISDVPIGAFLSGGIDSSLVVALMQAQSSSKVRTFSIGNPSARYDESAAAAQVAAHLGTDHTSFTVTAEDALGVVPQLGALYDEPFADSSQIPTFLVSRLARQQVTVALTGDGGDEVFAGYNRHIWGPRVWSALQLMPTPARAALSRKLLSVPPERYDAVLGRLLPAGILPRLMGGKLHKLGNVLGASSGDAFYRALCSQWLEPQALLRAPSAAEPPLRSGKTGKFATDMMLLDLLSYLPDDVLTKVDRATMTVALEARAPFLDHRVVELGWRLPLDMKVRGTVGKSVLRQLLYRYVPQALVDRPKMGFAVPIGDWLRGPLRDWAEDLLRFDSLRDAPVFRDEAVRTAWRDHLSGARDHGSQLWTLLMLQSWLNGPNGPSRPRPSS